MGFVAYFSYFSEEEKWDYYISPYIFLYIFVYLIFILWIIIIIIIIVFRVNFYQCSKSP